MPHMSSPFKYNHLPAEIGIIGGSGFYDLAENLTEVKIETPFGPPSDKLAVGTVANRKVVFLPRHGKTHNLPPHRINYRANLWALHSLGVKEIITAHACGSLQKNFKPGDVVVLDQFVDRTSGRLDTFFDGPVVTHVSTASPYCGRLQKHAIKTGRKLKMKMHPKGTAVIIQGPRFSTTAESLWFTKMGWDVINMTQYPEVSLARELQICYSSLAFVTDYDSGVVLAQKIKPVSAQEVVRVFNQNADRAKKLILEMIQGLPDYHGCPCQEALSEARV